MFSLLEQCYYSPTYSLSLLTAYPYNHANYPLINLLDNDLTFLLPMKPA